MNRPLGIAQGPRLGTMGIKAQEKRGGDREVAETEARSAGGRFPLARLLQLVMLLQGEGCPNARQLAEICEVSRRTIYRDLATLAEAGLPVSYRADRQGYQLSRGVLLHPPGLELREALALIMISRHWPAGDDLGLLRHAKTAVEKVVQTLPEGLRDRLNASAQVLSESLDRPHPGVEPQAMVDQILSAVEQRRQVRIRLRDGDGGQSESTKLGIYRLALLDGRWCLVGRSTLHRQVRLFPLLQIKSVESTTDPYEIPPRFSLPRYLRHEVDTRPEGGSLQVWLRVAPGFEERAMKLDWPSPVRIDRRHGEGAELRIDVCQLEQITPLILGLGDGVEVMSPGDLRSAVGELAARIAAHHANRPLQQSSPTTRQDVDYPAGSFDMVGG